MQILCRFALILKLIAVQTAEGVRNKDCPTGMR
ncbi:MAG: hypothetical protein H6Q07_3036, partial [Acidobacteria bacterium]|nr:hypothetical protein [Acidobacteriota bacterium]